MSGPRTTPSKDNKNEETSPGLRGRAFARRRMPAFAQDKVVGVDSQCRSRRRYRRHRWRRGWCRGRRPARRPDRRRDWRLCRRDHRCRSRHRDLLGRLRQSTSPVEPIYFDGAADIGFVVPPMSPSTRSRATISMAMSTPMTASGSSISRPAPWSSRRATWCRRPRPISPSPIPSARSSVEGDVVVGYVARPMLELDPGPGFALFLRLSRRPSGAGR